MNLQNTVDYHLKAAWHAINRMYAHYGGQHNLTQTAGYVLIHIDNEGVPATKIAPLLGMEPTSLSRLLRSLENDQLIYRKRDSHDKRVMRIFLTDKGKKSRDDAMHTVHFFNQQIEQSIEPARLQVFIETLAQIRALAVTLDNQVTNQ